METVNRARLRNRAPSVMQFEEYAAPEGPNVIGGLKFIGILCLVGSLVVSAGIFSSSTAMAPVAVWIAINGIMLAVLLFALALIAENLVALRKNSQHIAGVRVGLAELAQALDN